MQLRFIVTGNTLSIESGEFPEWELGLQIFSEEQAEGFSFDVLDSTKLVPEELVPLLPVGRMVLNRNPDNFFAETEQVAFWTPITSADMLNDRVLPFFAVHSLPMLRILTDHGILHGIDAMTIYKSSKLLAFSGLVTIEWE